MSFCALNPILSIMNTYMGSVQIMTLALVRCSIEADQGGMVPAI